MIYLDAGATTLQKPERVRRAMYDAGAGQLSRHAVGGGDGFSVPQSGGGAVRRGRPGKGGIHRQRHPRAEHCHQNAGKAGEPGRHLRV